MSSIGVNVLFLGVCGYSLFGVVASVDLLVALAVNWTSLLDCLA